MPKPTIELPDIPGGWLDAPSGISPDVPKSRPAADPVEAQGILGGWRPKDWSLEDSGIHAVLDPETVASIDFRGETENAGEQSGPANSRIIAARELGVPAIRPDDIDAKLPDIGAGSDRDYYSAAGGTVTDAGWENPRDHHQGYGYRIRVRGDDGLLFTYGHTDPNAPQVRVGDKVTTGQHLGSYGEPTNGRSTGPHTHFEVRDPSHPLQSDYDAYIKNSWAMGALVDPTPYADTVMPGGDISSKYGKRTIGGRQEFHPGIDLKRLRERQ